MKLVIAHLYPRLMNIYGDYGNIESLVFRAQKRNIQVTVRRIKPQDPLKPGSFNLLFAGGGQDRQQLIIEKDLQTKKTVLLKAAKANIPMLTVCGSFQLFGKYFKPFKGPKLKGIGIFDAYTIASKTRKIGNIAINTHLSIKPKTLIGFENHSGNTTLGPTAKPLGTVKIGFGNNGKDKTEGAIFNRAYGCYLHGSLLPKNPHLADYLIKLALQKEHGPVKLKPLKDKLEWQAHRAALTRAKKLDHPLLKYIP